MGIFSVRNICSWCLVIFLAIAIPCVAYITLADELLIMFLLALIFTDCLLHRCWSKYKPVWIVLGIMMFYVVYSYTFLNFNTLPYILYDALLELKPYVAFFAIFSIHPEFTPKQKKLISIISIVNCCIIAIALFGGIKLIELIIFHPAYCGTTIIISTLSYLYVNISPTGELAKKKKYLITLFLIIGLLCTRSKYYGECTIFLFMLYFFRPAMIEKINLKSVIAVASVLILVLIVSWGKIEYYFIKGNSETFDPTVIESFARPVLYMTGFLIFCDYFPFGSGLASFASFPSGANYSALYHQYKIDTVYGLTKDNPFFICDAYFPLLAQFGVVGIILFIYFLRFIYKKFKTLLNYNPNLYKYQYIIGIITIIFVLIESTSGTIISQCNGMYLMMLAGMIVGKTKEISTSPNK